MLTPVGVTATQYWSAIKAGNQTHVRMTFTGQNIVLEDQDIDLSAGVVVSDIFNGETDLVMGKAISKQMTTTFLNSSRLNGLNWQGEFTLEFGVEIGNPSTTYWVQIGIFSGEKPNNVTSARTIEFTAYDRMKNFDLIADEFVKSITYPATVQNIYDALCTWVGVQNDSGDELQNIMSRSYASAPATIEGYTYRDILAWIAEASCCYAKINASGHVQMKWFTDNTAHAVTATEEFSVESGDISDTTTYVIDQVLIKQINNDFDINYPSALNGNVYLIADNPFLSVSTASDTTDYIKPIYDRIYAFGSYLPVRVDCVGNWCVEAGDIITLDVDSDTVTFPIFVKEMRWNGGVNDSYEATGNKQRALYSNSATKQTVLAANKIEMYVEQLEQDVEDNYYQKKSGITIDGNGVDIQGNKYVNIQSGNSYLKLEPTKMQFVGGSAQIYTPDQYYCYINGFGFYRYPVQNNYNYVMSVLHNNSIPFGLSVYSNATYIKNAGELTLNPSGQTNRGVRFVQEGNYIVIYGDNGIKLGSSTYTYGDIDYIYGDYIYYKHLTQNSSKEIKHDIKPMESVGEKLDGLSPVTFIYNYDEKNEQRMGLIYEDTVEVMPEICVDNDGNKAINYVELIPALLKEIQDLRARVKELEERNGN